MNVKKRTNFSQIMKNFHYFLDVLLYTKINYTGRHKYFDETKVKYTHNVNLLLLSLGINGKVI